MRMKVFQLGLALILGVAIWITGVALAAGESHGLPGTGASRHHDAAANESLAPASHLYSQTPSTQSFENLLAVLPSGDGFKTLNIHVVRSAGVWDGARVSPPQVTAHHEPRQDPHQTPPFAGIISSPLTFYWHISHGGTPVGARSPVATSRDGLSHGDRQRLPLPPNLHAVAGQRVVGPGLPAPETAPRHLTPTGHALPRPPPICRRWPWFSPGNNWRGSTGYASAP